MLLVIVIICALLSILSVPSWAYYDEEADCLGRIRELKQSKIVRGDGTPTNIRLASELWRLGGIYLRANRFKDCDQAYTEMLSILSADKSQRGVYDYGYYAALAASHYTERGELTRAKEYIDTALRIGRTKIDPLEQHHILCPALSALAVWQIRQKQWYEAESTLLEITQLDGRFFGYPQGDTDTQEKLIEVYLQTNQLTKVERLIAIAERTTMPNSEGMFYRVRLLRAQGKVTEANNLEEQVRLKRKQEEENRKYARL